MAQDSENTQSAGLESVLNSVLSDPESMSRLASMASALASSGVLSGLVGGDSGGGEAAEPSSAAETADRTEHVLPQETAVVEKKQSGHSISGQHTALLRAIKPYLGAEKQARVDRIVKLLQLAELADTVLRGS